jgi:hypothetical protein
MDEMYLNKGYHVVKRGVNGRSESDENVTNFEKRTEHLSI